MRTDLFDYDLPPECVAQTPLPRGESRLLVLHRSDGRIDHRRFCDLPAYLRPDDILVLNDTRVTARRLRALRDNGQEAEVLLLRRSGEHSWEALVKPGRALRPGRSLTFIGERGETFTGLITGTTPEGGRFLQLESEAVRDSLEKWGETPLPPYIHTPLPSADEERYQTVYAVNGGSAAAPTAGLHFTPQILTQLQSQGVEIVHLTLHVGVGTFRPVKTEDIESHEMHSETVHLSESVSDRINSASGRVVAVGTTSVRTMETAAQFAIRLCETGDAKRVVPFTGETRLFLTPGCRFRVVDAMITNFHLPRSTLLMLVCAFAGIEAVHEAYRTAIAEKYRFFSFGDAMLIV